MLLCLKNSKYELKELTAGAQAFHISVEISSNLRVLEFSEIL